MRRTIKGRIRRVFCCYTESRKKREKEGGQPLSLISADGRGRKKDQKE
jgi:hypothetical protein